MFKMGKYLKQPNIQIVPFRMSLYLHIRVLKGKSKRKKGANKEQAVDSETGLIQMRSADAKPRRHKKKQKGEKSKDKKKKKRKRGRRIKIYVTNGEKTFNQMRMHVKESDWNKIELPISKFPEVINANDSFKLCIKCKRCGKKVKIDLFKKKSRTTRIKDTPTPTIPFIHFENRSQLPQPLHRHRRRRSYDVTEVIHQRHQNDVSTVTSPRMHLSSKLCCYSEVYTDSISEVFPRILYPESINITYCGTTDQTVLTNVNENINVSNDTHSLTNSQYKCVASSMDDFNYVYLDNSYNVKHAVIEKLIPSSCECKYVL